MLGWVRLALVQEGSELDLGAETMKYIVARLRAFLRQPASRLEWVMSLSETHVSAYGMIEGDGVLLRFQDEHAVFFADVSVPKAQQERWLAILDAASRETGELP